MVEILRFSLKRKQLRTRSVQESDLVPFSSVSYIPVNVYIYILFERRINHNKKTKVVHQPTPGKPYSEPTITVNGQTLQVVDKFTYLGSALSRAIHIGDKVTVRTTKASDFVQMSWSAMESDLALS